MKENKDKIIWTAEDVGCYVDGSHSAAYRREKMADMLGLLVEVGAEEDRRKAHTLRSSLRGKDPEETEGRDEVEALDLINCYCQPGGSWVADGPVIYFRMVGADI